MKHYAINRLLALGIVFLASIWAINIASAADILKVNNNTDKVQYVAIARVEYAQSGSSSYYGGSNVCTSNVVRGWFTIDPYESYTFWKGIGDFYIYMEGDDGSRMDPFTSHSVSFWVYEKAFESNTQRPVSGGYYSNIVPFREGTTETFDTYYWLKEEPGDYFYTGYNKDNTTFTNNYACKVTRFYNENESVGYGSGGKRSVSWLQDEIAAFGWKTEEFYKIPSDWEYFNLNP